MFDGRLEKPFLTVPTGEAYQPVRLTYALARKGSLDNILDNLKCIEKNTTPNSWTWYWTAECAETHFESIDSFRKDPDRPLRLGTIVLRDDKLYINLPSFKRACLAVPFFYQFLTKEIADIQYADFINKVFATDERLPHGFTELFKEEELDRILHQRVEDYHKVKEQCEHAPTAEEAFTILAEYTHSENQKRLPYAERYSFDVSATQDSDIVFLAFYMWLLSGDLLLPLLK